MPASGWVQYADTDVEGYHTFEVRMSGGSSSGRLDIRLGSVDGEIAGTIDLPASEGTQQAWYTDSCPIRGARGNQAVYICLTGDIRIAHFKFIR